MLPMLYHRPDQVLWERRPSFRSRGFLFHGGAQRAVAFSEGGRATPRGPAPKADNYPLQTYLLAPGLEASCSSSCWILALTFASLTSTWSAYCRNLLLNSFWPAAVRYLAR